MPLREYSQKIYLKNTTNCTIKKYLSSVLQYP